MEKVDITGQRYGWLVVLGDSGKRYGKKILWQCKCDCGKKIELPKDRLIKDEIPSCGCQSKKKTMYVGYKVGRLTVTEYLGVYGRKKKLWRCLCECGKSVIHTTSELNSNKVLSCGCLKLETGEKLKKYNDRDRKLYYRWSNMKSRCYKPNNRAYKNYGGRGIKMCPEWENDFYAFRDWAIQNGYDESLSIDRIDVNGDYCPENCRWTTNKIQMNNRRSNRYITIDGVTKTMKEWSEIYGIRYQTVQKRIGKGMSEQEAITTPSRYKNRQRT